MFTCILFESSAKPGEMQIKGGTFVQYDPRWGDEHYKENWVPEGYTVVEALADGKPIYTVISKDNPDSY